MRCYALALARAARRTTACASSMASGPWLPRSWPRSNAWFAKERGRYVMAARPSQCDVPPNHNGTATWHPSLPATVGMSS